ncbi:hypothetical protein CR513_49892, partial [Mucuna pruriens]
MKAAAERVDRPTQSAPTSTFWGQPFSKEIVYTPILANFRNWWWIPSIGLKTLMCICRPSRPTYPLVGGVTPSTSTNKAKWLEVADLFDIKQMNGENLKGYLSRFNNAKVRVNNPDKKSFVKAFQKGLLVGQFSDLLALGRPSSMEEIRA